MANFTIGSKPEKIALVDNDLLISADSEAAENLKKVKMSSILAYNQNNLVFPAVGGVKSITANYTILNTDAEDIYECDTTTGNITITLPDLASNYGQRYKIIHTIQGSSNIVTVQRAGTNVISADDLVDIELPKPGNYLYLYASQQSGKWEIIEEKIDSILSLEIFAGYGSADTKIPQFTNVREDIGNLFSHNHGSYGTEGLKITVKKTGKYSLCWTNAGSATSATGFVFTLNSTNNTIDPPSVPFSQKISWGTALTNQTDMIAETDRFNKNDILRPHSDGVAPLGGIGIFKIVYIG